MYFNKFPKILLDATDNDGITSGVVKAVDILRRVGFNSDDDLSGSYYFVDYDILDTDTPESISKELYGSAEYHWVVLIFNNIFDTFFEWPLSVRKLEKMVTYKYNGIDLYLDDDGISGSFLKDDTLIKHSGTGVTGWSCLVKDYDPVYHRININSTNNTFSVDDTIRAYNGTGGTNIENDYVGEATIKRIVADEMQSLHHFENSGDKFEGYDDIGGGADTSKVWIDPLSQYAPNGAGQVSIGPAGITYGKSLLYSYIMSGSSDYVKTNLDYEIDKNESKRTISLLKPEFLNQVVREFKALIKR